MNTRIPPDAEAAAVTNADTGEGAGRRFLRLLLAAFALSAVLLVPSPSEATAGTSGQAKAAGVDIAEDGTRFVFDENGPILENGFPDYGNAFVTQGYIYPRGTLGESDGVLSDGSPEYPDLVIGTWTCWGYFIGDGADTVDGPWVITTQLFELDTTGNGGESIVTVGTETPAGNPAVTRAVTGGTGRFARARGQMSQLTLGHNASEGVNATFDFDLVGARPIVRHAVVRF